MMDETSSAEESAGGKVPIPIWVWVLIAALALLLACACITMATGVGVLGVLSSQQPNEPVIIVPPIQEQPTQVPAEPEPAPEQPTQAPPEQPTEPPPEQPAEPPAEEQPPEAGQLPTEPDTSGSSCVPLASGLVLAPLLVIGKKTGFGRRSDQ